MRQFELAGADRDLLDLDATMLEITDTRVVLDGNADEPDGKSESGVKFAHQFARYSSGYIPRLGGTKRADSVFGIGP